MRPHRGSTKAAPGDVDPDRIHPNNVTDGASLRKHNVPGGVGIHRHNVPGGVDLHKHNVRGGIGIHLNNVTDGAGHNGHAVAKPLPSCRPAGRGGEAAAVATCHDVDVGVATGSGDHIDVQQATGPGCHTDVGVATGSGDHIDVGVAIGSGDHIDGEQATGPGCQIDVGVAIGGRGPVRATDDHVSRPPPQDHVVTAYPRHDADPRDAPTGAGSRAPNAFL